MASGLEYFFKSNSILNAMTPVIYLGSVLGMIPFKFNCSSIKIQTLFRVLSLIISFLIVSVYFYCFIFIMNLPQYSYLGKLPQVFTYSEFSHMISGFFIAVAINILKYCKRDYLENHFEIAEKLEEIFKVLGCERSFTFLKFKFFIASILELVFLISFFALSYMATQELPKNERLPVTVLIVGPLYTISFVQFLSSSFIVITRINLHTLNKVISKVQLDSKLSSSTDVPNNNILFTKMTYALNLKTINQIKILDYIWKSYTHICKNFSNLNDFFSLILLAVITLSFLKFLFNTFFAIYVYSTMPSLFPQSVVLLILFLNIVKCIANASNLFIISFVCNICEEEVSLKNIIVSSSIH